MTEDLVYQEKVSSNKTEALFLALTLLFCWLGPVRDISFSTRRPDDVLRLMQAAVSAMRSA